MLTSLRGGLVNLCLASMFVILLSDIAPAQEPQPAERNARPAPRSAREPQQPRPAANEDPAEKLQPADGMVERPGRPPTHAPPAPMRFEATVYRVEIPAERITLLTAASLTPQSNTAADLQKALAAIGTTRVLAHVDQITGQKPTTRIRVQGDAPYVTGTVTTPNGAVSKQVGRHDLGVTFEINSARTSNQGDGDPMLLVEVELSDVTSSGVNTGEDSMAPVFRKLSQTYVSAAASTGQTPGLLISVDGSSGGKDGMAVAYVTRLVLKATGIVN